MLIYYFLDSRKVEKEDGLSFGTLLLIQYVRMVTDHLLSTKEGTSRKTVFSFGKCHWGFVRRGRQSDRSTVVNWFRIRNRSTYFDNTNLI